MHGVDEAALAKQHGLLDELEDGGNGIVLFIEDLIVNEDTFY